MLIYFGFVVLNGKLQVVHEIDESKYKDWRDRMFLFVFLDKEGDEVELMEVSPHDTN